MDWQRHTFMLKALNFKKNDFSLQFCWIADCTKQADEPLLEEQEISRLGPVFDSSRPASERGHAGQPAARRSLPA